MTAAGERDLGDLEIFRRAVRDFVRSEVTPHALAWEEEGAIPRSLFRRLGELGYLGVRLSPDLGGGGLDFRYTAALVEEMVRCGSVGVAVSVMAHAEFATRVIDRAGSADLRETFVRPAIAGERVGALAVTEPGAGSDAAALATRAVRRGDDYVVDGAKTFITNASFADFVTAAVRTGGHGAGGLSLLVIPADAPGFRRGKRLRKLGAHASDTGEILLEACRVPARNLVGREGGGFGLILDGFRGERLVLATICCTQMRLMWEEARRWGHDRRAFGRPLLGYQARRHRLADALTAIEAAETLTARAVDLYVRGIPCDREISQAKLFAAEAAIGVGHDCAQIFGGYGFMEETPVARLQRDSLAFGVGAGTSEIMREIIAREAGLVPQEEQR